MKNEYLFEKYIEYYKNEDFHRLMNYGEFLKDPDIYKQIEKLFFSNIRFIQWKNLKRLAKFKKLKK